MFGLHAPLVMQVGLRL